MVEQLDTSYERSKGFEPLVRAWNRTISAVICNGFARARLAGLLSGVEAEN